MSKVKAKTVCFIDNSIRKEGDVFEYNGPKNSNVEILDAEEIEPIVLDKEASVEKRKWTPKNKTNASKVD